MNNEIKKFYEYLAMNSEFQAKLKEKLKKIHTEKEFENFISLEIMPLAKEKNYKFTQADLINYEKENIKHLTNEDLLNISGGISPKSLILSGSLFSLILLGSGTFSNTTAYAVLPPTTVKNSIDTLANAKATQNHEKRENNEHREHNETVPSVEPRLNDNNANNLQLSKDGQDESPIEGQNPQNDDPSHLQILLSPPVNNDSTSSDSSQNKDNLSLNLSNPSKNSQSANTSIGNKQSYEPFQNQMSTETVMNSSIILDNSLKQQTQVADMDYITAVLNLLDSYIYNISGATERFRFLDGNKSQITVGPPRDDGVPAWEFNKDEGEGSTNFMRCLFPSSAGTLNADRGLDSFPSFSTDCNPTPEMIAYIAGYIYNYVRCEDPQVVEETKEKLDNMINIIKSISKSKNKDINKINDIKKFFKDYLYYDLDDNSIDVKNNAKHLKTYLYLLKNATHMIQKQEIIDEKNVEHRVLPKYTTEKMLMCYFLQRFNKDSEVNLFYNEAQKIILSKNNNPNSQNNLNRLEKIKQVIDKISRTRDCPYTGPLVSNGSAQIIELTEDNKFKFMPTTFADCADTVVRHIINLLSYNDIDKWKFILGDLSNDDKQKLQNEITDVCRAINNNEVLDKKPFAERIIQFFYYQELNGSADIASQEARTFWNYIINNAVDETYKINYVRSNNNEMYSGWLNCLKLTYNILHALKANNTSFEDKLTNAKNKIDDLDKDFIERKNYQILKTKLKEAIESTFGIMAPIQINDEEFDKFEVTEKDIFATIYISKCDNNNNVIFTFPISHVTGHAFIDYSPCTVEEFRETEQELKEFLEEDPIVQLLAKQFSKIQKIKYSTKNEFNFYFGRSFMAPIGIDSTPYFKNYTILRFLKNIQGDGDNFWRINDLIVKYSIYINQPFSINIVQGKGKGKNTTSILQFVFDNYIKSKENLITFLTSNKTCITNNFLKNITNKYNNLKVINDGNNTILCKIQTDKTVAVLYIKNDIEITVPQKVSIDGNSYIVSEILGTVSNNIKKVSFQDGFETLSINYGAFENCHHLQEIVIPDSITSLFINIGAFFYCTSLKSFTIPNSVNNLSICGSAFNNCTSLATFNISNTTKNLLIDYEAFYSCTSLASFYIPASVNTLNIDSKAFFGCSNLKTFIIDSSISSLYINEETFQDCKSLTTFNIPLSVTSLSIGKNAFNSCIQLKNFNISPLVKSLTINTSAFSNCTSLIDFNIPESVILLSIGNFSFGNCSKLNSFTIPKNVESLFISRDAFNSCYKLKTFTILSPITSLIINDGTFSYCQSLHTFIIPDSVNNLSIGYSSFTSCFSLVNFNIPKSVTSLSIASEAFCDCIKLPEFTVPKLVTTLSLGTNAFMNCVELTKFDILSSITSLFIADGTFLQCKKLSEFTVPKSVTTLSLDNNAFMNCVELTKFNISSPITSLCISKNSFFNCEKLNEFNVPELVTSLSIAENAFMGCTGLAKFNMPDSVTSLSIDKNAFMKCTLLKEFKISKKLKFLSIGESAFENCNSLQAFYISSDIQNEDLLISNHAFFSCSSLTTFHIPNNTLIKSLVIGQGAFYACSSLITFDIPQSVTFLSIVDGAFSNCHTLTNINFSKSINELHIGEMIFFHCESLISLSLPQSITSLHISSKSFLYSALHSKDIIPNSVENLTITGLSTYKNNNSKVESKASLDQNNALGKNIDTAKSNASLFNSAPPPVGNELSGFKDLTMLNIPSSVTSLTIENNAFNGALGIKEFNIPSSVTTLSIGDNAFDGSDIEAFNIPDDTQLTSLSIGKLAFNSCKNLKKFKIPGTVKSLSIGQYSFYSCSSLVDFEISDDILISSLQICKHAFDNCTSLSKFNIPTKVTTLYIDKKAFKNCVQLTTFNIPKSIKKLLIGKKAFYSCSNLDMCNLSSIESLFIGFEAFKNSKKDTSQII